MTGFELKTHGRTFLTGKIIFNFGQSSIDCLVRRLTNDGATIEVASRLGVPDQFQLLIVGKSEVFACKVLWQSEGQVGVTYEKPEAAAANPIAVEATVEYSGEHSLRRQMLALRSALDQAPVGIVLLDPQLVARFINQSFRQMWALSDEIADRHPSFAALMFHGRDTGAYEMPDDQLENYIADRIELVTKNESFQLDLRRTKGDVFRMQCTTLPDGGRLLSYIEVTDIVRQADELRVLRDALENVQDGVLLLDVELNARFMNRKVREFWEIDEHDAAKNPSYASLITRARRALEPDLSTKALSAFAAKRIAEVKAGDHVRDLQTPDNRRLRAHCTNMIGGGRMITYYDVTDLVRNAQELERLATTDPLTGLYNRRHFLEAIAAEWSRFQRYYRSVSLLTLDIDDFKSINDRYGHAVGDEAIKAVADACLEGKRKSDVVGRAGGDEFAVLLPETNLTRARLVAERIRKRIAAQILTATGVQFKLTASIGVAEAFVSMSGVDAFAAAADRALYEAKSSGRNRCCCWSPPAPQAAKWAAE